jgi:hypothetical protein
MEIFDNKINLVINTWPAEAHLSVHIGAVQIDLSRPTRVDQITYFLN